MKLARVAGTVVSTIQHRSLDGRRLLLCDLVTPDGVATGSSVIAVDAVGAGAGELVLVLDEGTSARQVLALANAPIRAVVAAVVDDVALA